jgi:hypothetical protein
VFRLSPRISKVFRVAAKQAVRLLFRSWGGIFGRGLWQSSYTWTIYAVPSWRRHSLVIYIWVHQTEGRDSRRHIAWSFDMSHERSGCFAPHYPGLFSACLGARLGAKGSRGFGTDYPEGEFKGFEIRTA